ncbi:MAG: hypothetical protein KIT13_09955 [Burkholderiales bacterium]|nr:hypothetical protein [Burkholderiales bacterium]
MQFGELLQRDFQPALADETPGSDHVGNDVDAQALVHGGSFKKPGCHPELDSGTY